MVALFSPFALFALFATLAAPAHAGGILEPQVRVHAGLNYVSGPSPFGIAGGLDARLTRVLAIDLGGFGSFSPISESEYVERDDDRDYYHLRHGVYFAPGIRIPHAQPRTWAWDIFIRGGAGVLWYTDTHPDSLTTDAPGATTTGAGGFGGADAMVRVGNYGVRLSGRAWIFEAQHQFGGHRPHRHRSGRRLPLPRREDHPCGRPPVVRSPRAGAADPHRRRGDPLSRRLRAAGRC